MMHVIRQSSARKVTGLPVINLSYDTCPLSCELNPNNPAPDTGGCYAAQGHGGGIERVTRKNERDYDIQEVVDIINQNPAPYIRDRQVGDLVVNGKPSWSHARFVNRVALATRKRAFGYTSVWRELERYELSSYTLNASCLSEQDVSDALDRGWDATVIADDKKTGDQVEGHPGFRYFECPAEDGTLVCHQCRACIRSNRSQVVVFKPHGSKKNLVKKILARKNNKENK